MPRFEAAEEDDVVAAIDAARQRPEIEAALERLSGGERDVLELVAFHGLSPQEAALALDVSANASRLRLSRARRRMRAMIDGHAALDWSGFGAELA